MMSREELAVYLEKNPFAILWEIVYQELYTDIMYARIMPGDKINEIQLATALGVSRSPVKQAVERLCSEGLLRREGNKMAEVQAMTFSECMQLYEARKMLETTAVYLAAKCISAADLKNMENLLQDMKKGILTDDYEKYRIAEKEFHKTIIFSTNNKYIIRIYDNLSIDLSRYQFTLAKLNQLPMDRDLSLARQYRIHKRIYTALRSGFALEAQNAIEEDLMCMYRIIVNVASK